MISVYLYPFDLTSSLSFLVFQHYLYVLHPYVMITLKYETIAMIWRKVLWAAAGRIIPSVTHHRQRRHNNQLTTVINNNNKNKNSNSNNLPTTVISPVVVCTPNISTAKNSSLLRLPLGKAVPKNISFGEPNALCSDRR